MIHVLFLLLTYHLTPSNQALLNITDVRLAGGTLPCMDLLIRASHEAGPFDPLTSAFPAAEDDENSQRTHGSYWCEKKGRVAGWVAGLEEWDCHENSSCTDHSLIPKHQ